ncbi:MAG: hypothetical protein FVQ81_10785 [Candidatus Glassbacteria bacterium]|nr:hypothetical protein [Candidatus Glassbacteria bacterium]
MFCGNKPKNKSNEHVLPRWLLKLTGEPSRQAKHGIVKSSQPKIRQYAFDEFKFPSCAECNEKYSELENKAKNVVENILHEAQLTNIDISCLLDWFDKVRIGLWLAYYYLDKNIASVRPAYHISSRIRKYDRLLVLVKIKDAPKGINYTDCESLCFYHTPSCFSLRINEYYILNMSFEFLFSHRIGFPFPKRTWYLEDNNLVIDLEAGIERYMLPLIRKPFLLSGTEFYQPIFSHWDKREEIKYFYDCDSVVSG